jgi:CPA1 family monovalent cation:H+ antiporter
VSVWRIVAVVAAGIAYGFIAPGQFAYALGHATLYVFLPPLLFEAAWNLNLRAAVRQWPAIATLAGPGVLLTALVVAGALAVVRVPFATALLAGAILSATDPIAVVAIFRRLKVPRTLSTIVECESLFNDAVAVVLYRGVLLAVAAGASAKAVGLVTLLSIGGSLGGVALGALIAFVAARALRSVRVAEVQIAATVVCAYGSYFAAETLHLSGIFAAISCGIALRHFERRWITLNLAEDVNRFWDLAALVANVLVFFMLGAALRVADVLRNPAFVIATLAGVALARFAVAGLLLPGGYPRAWLDVVRVAAMRGALSIALAISLPEGTPYRSEIVGASFAVAIATIVSGAFTVPAVVAKAARARQ